MYLLLLLLLLIDDDYYLFFCNNHGAGMLRALILVISYWLFIITWAQVITSVFFIISFVGLFVRLEGARNGSQLSVTILHWSNHVFICFNKIRKQVKITSLSLLRQYN